MSTVRSLTREQALLRVYRRLLSGCRTANEVARVHIRLEDVLSPREMSFIAEQIMRSHRRRRFTRFFRATDPVEPMAATGAQGPAPDFDRLVEPRDSAAGRPPLSPQQQDALAVEWATSSMASRSSLGISRRGMSYARLWRRGGAMLYAAEQRRQPEDARVLTVCFTGRFKRMMMPLHAFLSELGDHHTDVLLLRSAKPDSYATGIQSWSTDFAGTLHALASIAQAGNYSRVVVLGSSLGALPAIVAALTLGSSATLVGGAQSPQDQEWNPWFDPERLAELATPSVARAAPVMVLAYGADNAADETASAAVAALLPQAKLLPVHDSGHNCFYALAQRGELVELLAELYAPGR